MHPTIVERLATDRHHELLAEAAAHRQARQARHAHRDGPPAARRVVGSWLVSVGTWVAGPSETAQPAVCRA